MLTVRTTLLLRASAYDAGNAISVVMIAVATATSREFNIAPSSCVWSSATLKLINVQSCGSSVGLIVFSSCGGLNAVDSNQTSGKPRKITYSINAKYWATRVAGRVRITSTP